MNREADTASLGASVAAAVKVAVTDTAKNFFNPLHNARVLLGLEKEQTLSQRIRGEEANIERRGSEPSER